MFFGVKSESTLILLTEVATHLLKWLLIMKVTISENNIQNITKPYVGTGHKVYKTPQQGFQKYVQITQL